MNLSKEDLEAIDTLINRSMEPIKKDIIGIKKDVSEIKKDISEMKEDIRLLAIVNQLDAIKKEPRLMRAFQSSH